MHTSYLVPSNLGRIYDLVHTGCPAATPRGAPVINKFILTPGEDLLWPKLRLYTYKRSAILLLFLINDIPW